MSEKPEIAVSKRLNRDASHGGRFIPREIGPLVTELWNRRYIRREYCISFCASGWTRQRSEHAHQYERMIRTKDLSLPLAVSNNSRQISSFRTPEASSSRACSDSSSDCTSTSTSTAFGVCSSDVWKSESYVYVVDPIDTREVLGGRADNGFIWNVLSADASKLEKNSISCADADALPGN